MKLSRHLLLLLALAAHVPARTLPAGATLDVRLATPISSYTQKPGALVEAIVLTPASEQAALPNGARIVGVLEEVKRIGFGVKRGRAVVRPRFDTLLLPDCETIPIEARVIELDNAREVVDSGGRILGIRATSVFGHRMAGITRNIFIWDPLLQMVLAGATLGTLRFPEAEIHLPSGSEFTVRLLGEVELRDELTMPLPAVTSEEDSDELNGIVQSLTLRTVEAKTNRHADLVNVLLLGEEEWLERAITAAGWVKADPLTKATGWKTFRSVAEALPYPEAPMSPQLLDENTPRFEISKTINTYSKRHHARVFKQQESFRDRPIFAAAATHDVAIDFSFRRMRPTHLIDASIDKERAKFVNDLIATGCVDAAQLFERPWAPREIRTTSGQRLSTDGRIAVLELNPCRRATYAQAAEPAPKPSIWRRIPRQFFLTVRNDFTHNNPVYQAGIGIRYLWGKMTGREPTRRSPSR